MIFNLEQTPVFGGNYGHMSSNFEGFIKGYKDVQIFVQKTAISSPAGTLLITHGQGEHSGSYERLIESLRPLALEIFSWDLRGHGRSEGLRGYAESFDDYCKDLESVIKFVYQERRNKKAPTFFLGHSMGATVQLKTLIDNPQIQSRAQILSSPLLGLAVKVPKIKDLAVQIMQHLTPQLTLWNEIRDEQLTRDPEVIMEHRKDSLRHQRISAGVYIGILNTLEYIKNRIDKMKIPIFCQISDADEIVSSETTKQIFKRLSAENNTLRIYKDSKHEIYNDLDREEVYKDLNEYLKIKLHE